MSSLDPLPPERVAEAENFIDFLRTRGQERRLTRVASKVAKTSFAKVWDNTDDAAYDQL